jgi:hypothetical protein
MIAELGKAANLTTMSEAALATIAVLSDRFGARIEEFSWSVDFTDSEWIAHQNGIVAGKDTAFTMTGFVWGSDRETLSVNYSGLGHVGGEPLLVNGTAQWLYNKDAHDYQEMNFSQVTKIGSNSFWGWVLGAEVIAGVGGGGLVAVGTAVTATGGMAIGAAPWLAAGGAVGGAVAFVTLSNGVKSLLESKTAPPPPPMPERPSLPKKGEMLALREGHILVVFSEKAEIYGFAIDGVHTLSGNYSFEEGHARGSIQAPKK